MWAKQATTDTAAAQAAAEAAAIDKAKEEVAGVGSGGAAAGGGSGETTVKAFELYKLSHNIKKMLGEVFSALCFHDLTSCACHTVSDSLL